MSNDFTIDTNDDGQLAVVGELTRKSIIGKQQKVFADIVSQDSQDIDLSKLNKVDTAGLAWLIALFEFAAQKQIKINYSQPPLELVKLATLSRVNELLALN
ncbi:STAS domain-containing protein [Thalassotalea sp. HSM 43]|uniref:STAS domain-containing protein n=1 Tax=Thalassotalea sp. HSM 43 TaxID=2552945 RepID=UPI0010820A36|nr:STAS domain-containing protein [Thalassotalea sp. HSM 43]QBY04788.1 STAS domain-containing protein [Thalassotalea sp. HSM 43]